MAVVCGYLSCALLSIILAGFLFVLIAFRYKDANRKVCIVVLGDIGRSPRMQYHASSFAKESFQVNIVGFYGSSPITSLRENDNVCFTYVSHPPNKPSFVPGSLFYIFKAIFQWLQLFIVLLFHVEKPGHFLVQNPPAIPTLSVVWVVSRIKGSYFAIDWHNYAFTILAMNLKKENHILVRFSKWYEGAFGYLSDRNFCVTEAMKTNLNIQWGIKADVLYDKPPVHFKETPIKEKHELFTRLYKDGYTNFSNSSDSNSTTFTKEVDKEILYQDDCPALIISSTSWTDDEDFSILLNALEMYDNKKDKEEGLPRLFCVITGKGPQKQYYLDVLSKKNFSYVEVITPWLSAEDYPRLIGSGNLGICLHTSSSGLDLPMKVVDMFGCALPVCAVSFWCLNELVKHNVNGLVFSTSDELCSQMVELLKGFPDKCEKLNSFRENLKNFQVVRWHDNWLTVMSPMIS